MGHVLTKLRKNIIKPNYKPFCRFFPSLLRTSNMIENLWLAVKYFFLYPLFVFLPPPFPYRLARFVGRLEWRYHRGRRDAIKGGLELLLNPSPLRREEINRIVQRYFEVASCDEIDIYIYLSWSSKMFLRSLRIDGLSNLKKALEKRGGIFLSAHFGGGFWILPFLRKLGVPVHFFSAEIKRGDHPDNLVFYLYQRLRVWAVKKASGAPVLSRKYGKKAILRILEKEEWAIILFDVPPPLVKEHIEVTFLGKKALLPKGIISIAKDTKSPILPFFSYLDAGQGRGICFEEPFLDIENEDECGKRCAKLIEDKILERPDHWHFWPVAEQFFSQ